MGLSALDQLLGLLLEGGGSYYTRLLTFGFTEDEIGEALDGAGRAGYTEATGLGADRLTEGDALLEVQKEAINRLDGTIDLDLRSHARPARTSSASRWEFIGCVDWAGEQRPHFRCPH